MNRISILISVLLMGYSTLLWAPTPFFQIGNSPYLDFQAAHDAVTSNPVIQLINEPTISYDITITKNITLDGVAVTSNQIAGNNANTASASITILNATVTLINVNVSQLTSGLTKDGIHIQGGTVLIENSVINNNQNGIVATDNTLTITNTVVSGNMKNGLRCDNINPSNIVATGNIFQGNGASGVAAAPYTAFAIHLDRANTSSLIQYNNFVGNKNSLSIINTAHNVDCLHNWWGTSQAQTILDSIIATPQPNMGLILDDLAPDGQAVDLFPYWIGTSAYTSWTLAYAATTSNSTVTITKNRTVTDSIILSDTNKTVILQGESPTSSIVLSTQAEQKPITIQDARSIIRNLSVQHSGGSNVPGIFVNGQSSGVYLIEGVTVSGNYRGIEITGSNSFAMTVSGNVIQNNTIGVNVTNTQGDIVLVSNVIEQNTIFGVWTDSRGSFTMQKNQIKNNSGAGLQIATGAAFTSNSLELNIFASNGSPEIAIQNDSTVSIYASRNYWGSSDSGVIEQLFRPTSTHKVSYSPFLYNDPTNYVISKTYTSVQDGDWFAASTWTPAGVPDNDSQVIIGHNVRIPGTGSREAAGDIKKINILSSGELVFEESTAANKLHVDGSIFVSGNLVLNAYSDLYFVRTASYENMLQVEQGGRIVLLGGESLSSFAKITANQSNVWYGFQVNGTIVANNFGLTGSSGLDLMPSAKVGQLSVGRIANVGPDAAHIQSAVPFVASSIVFDESGQETGAYNVKLVQNHIAAFLVNCVKNNSLENDSGQDGSIEWISKQNLYPNMAADMHLADVGASQGVAVGDVNNDDLPDVFVCNSNPSQDSERPTNNRGLSALYLNQAGDSFENITASSNLIVNYSISKAIFGDYDNDGDQDILILSPSNGIKLWENQFDTVNRVRFADVSNKITNHTDSIGVVVAVQMVDLDQDNLLDIIAMSGNKSIMLRQTTSKTFRANQPITVNSFRGVALGIYAAELDQNNHIDIVALSANGITIFYQQDNNQFTEVFHQKDLLGPMSQNGTYRSISFADFNSDGLLDIIFGVSGQGTFMLGNRNNLDAHKTSSMRTYNINNVQQDTYQALVMDINGDQGLDVALPASSTMARIFRKTDQQFSFANEDNYLPVYTFGPRGHVVADLNRDGAPDIYVASTSGGNGLFMSTADSSNHWLTVRIKGDSTHAHRYVGTRVNVQVGSTRQSHQFTAGNGYQSQSFSEAYFNIGAATKADIVEVVFLDGTMYTTNNITVSPTRSITVDSTLASAGANSSEVTFVGTYKDHLQSNIVSGKIIVMNVTSGNISKEVVVGNGNFSITANSQIASMKLRFMRLLAAGGPYFTIQSPEFVPSQNQTFALNFPDPRHEIKGKVELYNQAKAGITIKAFALEMTQGYTYIVTANTQSDGTFKLPISDGNWTVQYYQNGTFLSNHSETVQTGGGRLEKDLGVMELKDVLQDTNAPTVTLSTPTTSANIQAKYEIKGTVSDDIEVREIKFYYALSSATDWIEGGTKAITNQTSVDGTLFEWNTYAVADGTYKIKVKAKDGAGNEKELTVSNVIIANIPADTYKQSYTSGLFMMSVPFDVSSKTFTQLGITKVARYDAEKGEYQTNSTSGFETTFAAGKSYWVKLDDTLNLDLTGTPAFYSTVKHELKAGWQMIANPFYYSIAIKDIMFVNSTKAHTLDEALTAGLIMGAFYQYSASKYEILSSTAALAPWSAIWIRLLEPLTVEYRFSTSRTASLKVASYVNTLRTQKASEEQWFLRLVLKDKDRIFDSSNIFGVNSTAKDNYETNDLLAPPSAVFGADYARLYFQHADWKENSGLYAVDIRSQIDEQKEWDILVDGTHYQGDELSIELDQLNKLPDTYSVRLYDYTSGDWSDIRHRDDYTFNVAAAGYYRFKLSVEDMSKTLSNVKIAASNKIAYPNPFNPLSSNASLNQIRIKYTLNKPATGRMDIYSVSGRLVKTFDITTSQYGLYDTNTILWDGKDAFGYVLPNDVYIYLMYLEDADGNTTREKGKIVLWKE